MSAAGSCCQPCEPCHNDPGCAQNPAIKCVPRHVCLNVDISPGQELCCPSRNISVHLQYDAATGECGSWVGTGQCGRIRVGIEIILTENESPDAELSVHFVLYYDADIVPTIDVSTTVTIPDGGSVSFSLGTLTNGGDSFDVSVGEANILPHPYNGLRCNPCACVRCLPAGFCARIVKIAKDQESELRCEGCYAAGGLVWDSQTCSWSGTLICGLDTFAVAVSLAPVYDGICAFDLAANGTLSGTVRVTIESVTAPASPVSCIKCCEGARLVGRYGTDCPGCANCEADAPEDDQGCGKGLLYTMSSALVLEDDDWIVTITVDPMWCAETCQSTESGCEDGNCCPNLSYEDSVFCPEAPRPSLTATFDAPGCDFDGYTVGLTPRTAFHPPPAGTPATGGVCGLYASELFSLACHNADGEETTIQGYLAFRCIPIDAVCDEGTPNPYNYKLLYQWQAPCLGAGNAGDVYPSAASCEPPDFTFNVDKPTSTLVPPFPISPCNCCDTGGGMIIHVSE